MRSTASDDATPDTVPPGRDGVYAFGPFRLDPVRRRLLRDGVPVNLTARLLNALITLVANHDRMVTREELKAAVWRSRVVEDNNLGQAIYGLRKVLQAGDADAPFVVTVPGRGYQFVSSVTFEATPGIPRDTRAGDERTVSSRAEGALYKLSLYEWRARSRVLALSACCGALLLAAFGAAQLGLLGAAPNRSVVVGRDSAFAPPPHSIAVLPFTSLSGGSGQDYFSDGLAAELIASLGRLPALEVAAASSSFAFKGKTISSPEIGRRLGVRAVLEGSVRRDRGRLRVTATLIDTGTGYVLWAQSYDCGPDGVLRLQEQIAAAVAAAAQVTLLHDDGSRLALGGTDDPRALDAYLRGMKLRNEHTADGIRRAHQEFGAALAIDPHYVLAQVQDADILIMWAEGYGVSTNDPARLRALQQQALLEARDAVAKAPALGEAHAVLGLADAELWDFAGQRAELARAQTLAPSNSQILIAYARSEVDAGNAAAAVAAADHAAALDPLSPHVYADLAGVLMLARRPDAAVVALRHAAQLGFGGAPYTDLRARVELMQGDEAAAWRDCAGAQDWYQLVCQAMAGHFTGRQAEARAALSRLQNQLGDTAAYQYARIHAVWGEKDTALRWLATAYRVRDDGLIDIHADSFLDPIRDAAQFRDLERRLGIVPG